MITTEASNQTSQEPAHEFGTFDQLGLLPEILRAIQERGYQNPTEIQKRAIPEILAGHDIIGKSQTGTGKTAAFTLPTLTRLEKHGELRCLILEPTRELASQVYDQLVAYGKYTDLNLALLFGGVGYGRQREQLKAGPDVVVATPGRLMDHYGQRNLSFKKLECVILDEADRMLDMGFLPDVSKILRECPEKRQSLLFSATVPPEIKKLANLFLKNPVDIRVGVGQQPADTISHAIYPVDERQKFDLLVAILKEIEYRSVLVFCRTKAGADIIARWLTAHGHDKLAVLHADRKQRERETALADFKSGKKDILVATDIVARGIDISDVSHVINYDIPQNPEDYVHRIGRTGRMHAIGDAVTLYTASETDFLRSIENFIGKPIERKKMDDFDYKWSPILEDKQPPRKRKRNR